MSQEGQQVAIIVRAKNNPMPAILMGAYQTGKLKDFVILEEGTSGKQTSVAMHIKLNDNSSVIVQTTGVMLKMLNDATVGADQRFKAGLPTIPDMPIHEVLNEFLKINQEKGLDTGLISDGKNTFEDLYSLLEEAQHQLNQDCPHCGYELKELTNNSDIVAKINQALL
jgi:hypothetical protein